ncbi:MAG: DNA polymerase III subunit delta' [Peptococcaceae bacterium]|nr:DNA polymerase III subunit delta' [Peptococcaceae bacterium]
MNTSLKLLKKAVEDNRLAHLLILYGSGAKERIKTVLELAAMLNCTGDIKPCKICSACNKIALGSHPDFHYLQPSKLSIGIEQVLSLQEKIYRKIYEGKYRVCLIDEANKLTLPAANALLKIAEEPPENTLIILSCSNIEAIIPTLQSRAQSVYLPSPTLTEWEEEAEAFSLSGGDPDLARKIQKFGLDKMKDLIDGYLEMVQTGDFLQTFSLFTSLEKEDCLVFLQTLAVTVREMIKKGNLSPNFLPEIGETMELLQKQVNSRLALEMLALKHINYGGSGNWLK